MSSSKIVAVVGATGGQGGSVVHSLLQAGQFKIRAILRNPTPENSASLLSRGVEVVKADLDDKQSLIKAFDGAYAVFAVTNFFEPFMKHGPEKAEQLEYKQAKNLAQAAAATSSLSHYIWSTLPSSAKLSQGKYHVPHFESKASVDEYILKELPDLASKTTFLWVTYYAENLTFPLFTPNLIKTSGQYGWVQPVSGTTSITTIGNQRKNVGVFVNAILERPERTRGGKYVMAEVETLTNQALIERWGKVTGKPVTYIPTNLNVYDTLFPQWGLEMGVMLQFWEEIGGEKSWIKPGATILRKEDLGIDVSKLVGLDGALAAIKWD